jgi:hypothetical protein
VTVLSPHQSDTYRSGGYAQTALATTVLVYGWFTEGFDTTDLQEAKAL